MKKLIDRVLINKLFGNYNIDWKINDKVSVLVGKNGVGKTTILNNIYALLKSWDEKIVVDHSNSLSLVDSSKIYFNDNSFVEYSTIENSIEEFIEKILVRIEKNDSKEAREISSIIEKIREIENTHKKNSNEEGKINSALFRGKHLAPDELNKKIFVDKISTSIMNANSYQYIRASDKTEKNVLDIEVNESLKHFAQLDDEIKNRFVNYLNYFLKETNKKVDLSKNADMFFICNNKKLRVENLSSGERQLILTFIKVSISSKNKIKKPIFLLDEPEISLHLSWQENLLNALLEINPDAQILVATHSPAIIMNGWLSSYTELESICKRSNNE